MKVLLRKALLFEWHEHAGDLCMHLCVCDLVFEEDTESEVYVKAVDPFWVRARLFRFHCHIGERL